MRVVVKIGTSTLTKSGKIDTEYIKGISEEVAGLVLAGKSSSSVFSVEGTGPECFGSGNRTSMPYKVKWLLRITFLPPRFFKVSVGLYP